MHIEEETGAKDEKPNLTLKDDRSKFLSVPRKGLDPYALKAISKVTRKRLGYKKIVIRTDHEPSILDFNRQTQQGIGS